MIPNTSTACPKHMGQNRDQQPDEPRASVPVDNAALAHFAKLGRALVDTHTPEPRPKDFREIIERMLAIDPNCGMGTENPLGGDWQSHLAYIHNRRVRGKHGVSR